MSLNGILFFLTEQQLIRESNGYFKAFSKRYNTYFLTKEVCSNNLVNIEWLNKHKIWFIYFEDSSSIPFNINEIPCLTAYFHYDTYSGLEARYNISQLFDVNIIFHPQYQSLFKNKGINTLLLPHAVEADLFQDNKSVKTYDIGWVGRFDIYIYKKRKKIIEKLYGCSSLKINNIYSKYSFAEMAAIYKSSSISVNISRDDYPEDANLRCFEVMASKCLLITFLPTELEDFGFINKKHYIGINTEDELYKILQYYLHNKEETKNIVNTAYSEIINNHTYHNRIIPLISFFSKTTKRNINNDLMNIILFKKYLIENKYKEWFYLSRKINFIQVSSIFSSVLISKFFNRIRRFDDWLSGIFPKNKIHQGGEIK